MHPFFCKLVDDSLSAAGEIEVQGRAEEPSTLRKVAEICRNSSIDLLFIDGAHDFKSVQKHLRLYMEFFSPRCAVLDDIRLNNSMRAFWEVAMAAYGERAMDLSELSPRIREPSCGMGLLWLGEIPVP